MERPLSAGLLAVAPILHVITLLPSIRKGRDDVFVEN
jgi:putative tricarboxylic transport membrane protein